MGIYIRTYGHMYMYMYMHMTRYGYVHMHKKTSVLSFPPFQGYDSTDVLVVLMELA